MGDFNNDGAVDVLISNNDAAPDSAAKQYRRKESLAGHPAGRPQMQSRCDRRPRHIAGWRLETRRMKVGGGSFLSSHDPRMVLGIGKRDKVDWLEVKWPQPSGTVERFTDLPIDRYITLEEGSRQVEITAQDQSG